MAETPEEISNRPEIRKELQRATGKKDSRAITASGRDKFWLVFHAVILLACIAGYFLVVSKVIPLSPASAGILVRIIRGIALIMVLVAIARAISVYFVGRIEDPSTRFTLQRVVHLIVALMILVISISIIFVNW